MPTPILMPTFSSMPPHRIKPNPLNPLISNADLNSLSRNLAKICQLVSVLQDQRQASKHSLTRLVRDIKLLECMLFKWQMEMQASMESSLQIPTANSSQYSNAIQQLVNGANPHSQSLQHQPSQPSPSASPQHESHSQSQYPTQLSHYVPYGFEPESQPLLHGSICPQPKYKYEHQCKSKCNYSCKYGQHQQYDYQYGRWKLQEMKKELVCLIECISHHDKIIKKYREDIAIMKGAIKDRYHVAAIRG